MLAFLLSLAFSARQFPTKHRHTKKHHIQHAYEPEAVSNKIGDDIVKQAKTHYGQSYVYGATGPNTFDNAGFIYYVFKECGITIPRASYDIYKGGKEIDKYDVIPGHIVCFGDPSSYLLLGIYVGSGEAILCPPGSVVRKTKLTFGPENLGARSYID